MSPGTKGTGHSAPIIQWQNMRLLTAQCGFDSRWGHSPCHSIPIGRGTRLKIWKVWVRVPPMAPKISRCGAISSAERLGRSGCRGGTCHLDHMWECRLIGQTPGLILRSASDKCDMRVRVPPFPPHELFLR